MHAVRNDQTRDRTARNLASLVGFAAPAVLQLAATRDTRHATAVAMATKRTIAVRGIFSPRSIDELYEVRHVVVPYVDDEAEKLRRETPPPEDDEQPANEWWLHSAGGHNTDAHGDVAQAAAAHSERPSRQAAHADTVTLDETPAVAFCPAAIVGNYASGAVCAEADDAELDSAVLTISATVADATAGIAASPVAAHGAEWHQLSQAPTSREPGAVRGRTQPRSSMSPSPNPSWMPPRALPSRPSWPLSPTGPHLQGFGGATVDKGAGYSFIADAALLFSCPCCNAMGNAGSFNHHSECGLVAGFALRRKELGRR